MSVRQAKDFFIFYALETYFPLSNTLFFMVVGDSKSSRVVLDCDDELMFGQIKL